MGSLLIIALIAAASGALLGVVLGLVLLPLATPLAEHRNWFLGLCATLTASAAAVAALLALRPRKPGNIGFSRLLAAVLLGGLGGAFVAQQLYGYAPHGKQLLFFAGGAIVGGFLIGMIHAFRRKASDEPCEHRRGRWFQFTLGSLLAMTVIASAVLALWVRGPMERRQVLTAIERSGGGRVRYASIAPDWVVDLLGDWVRGFFDEVDEIILFDPSDADVARLSVLPHLRSLTLSGGKVTDEAMKAVARLTRLEELKLFDTSVSHKGLAELQRLPMLRSLGATQMIDNDALAEISRLAGLKTLSIMNHARLPVSPPQSHIGFDQLGKLDQLEELALIGLPATADDFEFLEQMPRLKHLVLSGRNITDAVLCHFGRLRQLEELCLALTNVTGSGFEAAGELTQLRKLDMTRTPVTEDGLQKIAAFKNLESLNLSQTDVTDADLAYLKPLTKLQHLDLRATRISDKGLSHLEELTNIRSFSWNAGNITAGRVQQLENAWRAGSAADDRQTKGK